MAKKIEEKYQELSEVQHILQRPGMWVGSIKSEEKDAFMHRMNKLQKYEEECDMDKLYEIFLGIYANPVDSKSQMSKVK